MKLTILLIPALFVGGYATAGPKTFGDGSLPDYLAACDADGNGIIDEEERQAMEQVRKEAREQRRREIDTDGDGVISDEEREKARQAIRDRIEAKRKAHFDSIAGDDGLLTFAEFSALPRFTNADPERVQAIFDHLNTDDSQTVDGEQAVTYEEFTARLRRHRDRNGEGDHDGDPVVRDRLAERFAAIAGEDGLVSLEEFMALPHPAGATDEQIAARFNALDTDGDAGLSFEEFFRRGNPERPGEPEGPGGPGEPEGPGGRR